MKLIYRFTGILLSVAIFTGIISSCSRATEGDRNTPLVIGSDEFSRKFSVFFGESVPDIAIANLVTPSLMTTDRTGAIVYNAIGGEKIAYNGTDYEYTGPADIAVNIDEAANTTTYSIKIRDDIKFSDGKPLTADDIIFTYYVLADPSYTGSSTLYSVDIIGMNEYRTQISSAANEKYGTIYDDIVAAGRNAETNEQSNEHVAAVWSEIDTAWSDAARAITEYVADNYGSDEYVSEYFTGTVAELENDGFKTAFAMVMWGFGTFSDGTLTTFDDSSFNISESEYPTLDDFINAAKAKYNDDLAAFSEVETDGICENPSVLARNAFIKTYAATESNLGGEITRIEGIKKLSETEVEVVTNGFDAAAIYQICGISIAPLHYYGNADAYNYENDEFGFERGDLSSVTAKTTEPLGWGPYKFVKYENKVVYLEANAGYYKGEPKIKNIQYKETSASDKISGVTTGVLDVSDPSISIEGYKEIAAANSNGEATGDKITTSAVDVLGYGFIGLNAKTINVGGITDSAASKNLRKGIATILAAYRDLTVDSYYGDTANVINYPISSTSWAAPRPSDEGYRVAYSLTADGSEIYSAAMSSQEKYEAAKSAALGYFEAAGYTVTDGKLTAAPEGAKLNYEIIIGAGGSGDHPTFALLTAAKEAFSDIGLTLSINDPADSNTMWDMLNAGTQEMWCAAWSATIDPDMYQLYHSTNIIGAGGSGSNYYCITDSVLDKNIIDARMSADQSYRKGLYKECLDIILDWGVEVPVYQRQDTVIFSTERINTDTLPKDITTYRGWTAEIETLEMR